MTTVTRYIYIPRRDVDIVTFCISEALKAEGFDLDWGDQGQTWLVRGTQIKDGVQFSTTCYWTAKREVLPWRNCVIVADDARYVAIVSTVNAVDDNAQQLAKESNDRVLANYRCYMEHPASIFGGPTGCLDHGA